MDAIGPGRKPRSLRTRLRRLAHAIVDGAV